VTEGVALNLGNGEKTRCSKYEKSNEVDTGEENTSVVPMLVSKKRNSKQASKNDFSD